MTLSLGSHTTRVPNMLHRIYSPFLGFAPRPVWAYPQGMRKRRKSHSRLESPMSARAITLVLGTAGAFLAAGLIPLATTPVAHAVCIDDSLGCDTDFISATDPLLKMFGITEIGAADPDTNFEGMILNIPSLGITDVLTSGKDTSDL